jgi:P-type conjugative transfer protein TrbJ
MRKSIIAKKILVAVLIILSVPFSGQAFFGGGGITGPLPVYNTDKTVDAATIATQINTLKQLEAALAVMDSSTASQNMQQIQNNLMQLEQMQSQMEGLITDYANFQNNWNEQYNGVDYNNMSGSDYANHAQALLDSMNQSVYNAMRAQGYNVAYGDVRGSLQNLLQSSQSAEGALAAAQVGNQIAALQAQQMMQFQQMVTQSNQAQTEWMKYQLEKERNAQALAEQAFGE